MKKGQRNSVALAFLALSGVALAGGQPDKVVAELQESHRP
jgi:hypothetical protein